MKLPGYVLPPLLLAAALVIAIAALAFVPQQSVAHAPPNDAMAWLLARG